MYSGILGNCEILEKGNLEILRKSKMAHEGNIKSGLFLKYLLVYFKTKTNISDTAKIVCWQVKKYASKILSVC